MADVAHMLNEWHEAVGEGKISAVGFDTAALRARLIMEEAGEASEALINNCDRAHIAKELADLVYVAYGAARVHAIPLDAIIREVHCSNMTKLKGDIERRPDGKIIKGKEYKEPNVRAVLELYDFYSGGE